MFCIHLDGEERELVTLLFCLPGVSWLMCCFFSWCHGFVCFLWLWYFPIILTYYFWVSFMWTVMALASLQIWISLEPKSLNQNLVCRLKCLFYTIYATIWERLWPVCTFAWSSLSLCHSSKFSGGGSNGDWMPFCASSKGSGDSAHLHRLTLAFVTVQNLLFCLKWGFVCYWRQQWILWVCTLVQAKSLDIAISIKISCAGREVSWKSAHLHRLAWPFVTVSNYHVLALMAILVTFMWTANAVVSLHQQPRHFCATISALFQCFKKMLPVRCNNIPQ